MSMLFKDSETIKDAFINIVSFLTNKSSEKCA